MVVKKGYKQTEVGVIPEDWTISSVGNEFTIQLGKMLDSEKNIGVPKPFLGNRCVQWGRFDLSDLGTIKLTSSDLKRFRLQDGDLLVCEGGEIGRAAIWRSEIDECYFQKALHRLQPKKSYVVRFMLYILEHLSAIGFLSNYVTQTSIAHLPKDKFETVPVPLPPLHEQEAIAGALSDADAWIESLEQLIAKKRQIKQGAMQELLTGKRRLPGFSGKWETKRLGDLGSFYSGGTPNTSIPEYYGGDIPWITSSDCNAGCIRSVVGRLTPAGVANSATKWVVPGTVLMALYGATAGVVAISKIDATINQAVLAMKLDSQDSSFMFQKLSMMKDWIIQTYTQGGQPNLSGAIVKSIELELPAYDEQVAIAIVLSDMDIENESLESKLAKAREVKQGMMQELLTGRIRLI